MTKKITRPGKFEGEPEYVEHFWNHLDEADDEQWDADRLVAVFRINREDCARWPGEFDTGDRLELWEDDQGFVRHRLVLG